MLRIFVPAKPFSEAKLRLAPVLEAPQRAALARALLARTLRITRAALPEAWLFAVSPTDEVAETARMAGADDTLVAAGNGLNAQLAEVAARMPARDALLVLHADLPWLVPADLAALVSAGAPVVLAPDHTMRGSNALLQRAPERFFAFGPESCRRHAAEAALRGLEMAAVGRLGLARDLDTPDDWRLLTAENNGGETK